MIELQEENLVAQARRGDQTAFEMLVRRYEKRVLALSCRMCANPDDGAEAAQEAFLAAWQGLPSFRGDSGFSTWLYRLTCNACMDHLRREHRRNIHSGFSLDDEQSRRDFPDPSPTPQERAEQHELREQIESAMQSLSPEHREVLILREMHQLSYEEIGQVLSLDAGTVKSRISRARGKLRKILLESGNFSAPVPSEQTGKEGWKK